MPRTPAPASTPRRRVTKPPESRRRDLLDGAARVFRDKGITRATVADIAEAAGMATGTFYLHFESKEHLVGALKASFVEEILQRMAALIDGAEEPDWWALVDRLVETSIDYLLERRDLIRVFAQVGEDAGPEDVFAASERRMADLYARGIEAGIEAGVFGVEDPPATAFLLHHAVLSTVQHVILYDEPISRDRLLAASINLVHRALEPPGHR